MEKKTMKIMIIAGAAAFALPFSGSILAADAQSKTVSGTQSKTASGTQTKSASDTQNESSSGKKTESVSDTDSLFTISEGNSTYTASGQKMDGAISIDDDASFTFVLADDSSFDGSIASEGESYVIIEDGSTWKLEGNSSVSSLTCDDDSIDLNGYTLTVDGRKYSGTDGESANGNTPSSGQPTGIQPAFPGNGSQQSGMPDNGMQPPQDGGPQNGNPPQGGHLPGMQNGNQQNSGNTDGKTGSTGKTTSTKTSGKASS